MIRRPPRSTLFPTRRSSDLAALVGRGFGQVNLVEADDRLQAAAPGGDGHPVHQDRKSTRLNSSHANISYAVFCLKKKKKNTPTYPHKRQQTQKTILLNLTSE